MSRKPAKIRIYFDADVLGLAKLGCQERADCTFPGDPGGRVKKLERPPCPIVSTRAKDRDWIPVVANLGWLIITRDRRIQDRLPEVEAVGRPEPRWSTWPVRDIEALVDTTGPFIYIASRTGRFRAIPLDSTR